MNEHKILQRLDAIERKLNMVDNNLSGVWEKLWDEYTCVAKDADGNWYAYTSTPTQGTIIWTNCINYDYLDELEYKELYDLDINWRDSLSMRPPSVFERPTNKLKFEEIWDRLEPSIVAIAMDRNYRWHTFQSKPYVSFKPTLQWVESSAKYQKIRIHKWHHTDIQWPELSPHKSWTDSLYLRPGNE